jgi:hypothetical protein
VFMGNKRMGQRPRKNCCILFVKCMYEDHKGEQNARTWGKHVGGSQGGTKCKNLRKACRRITRGNKVQEPEKSNKAELTRYIQYLSGSVRVSGTVWVPVSLQGVTENLRLLGCDAGSLLGQWFRTFLMNTLQYHSGSQLEKQRHNQAEMSPNNIPRRRREIFFCSGPAISFITRLYVKGQRCEHSCRRATGSYTG